MTAATVVAAAVLVLIHVFAHRLRFLHTVPRSRWLSMAGGMSVAYVFVHLLPELSEAQEAVAERAGPLLSFTETHVYLIALVGLSVFYALERAHGTGGADDKGGEGSSDPRLFWIAISSFGLYNLLVGYLLLHRHREGPRELLLFTLAMALHLLVTDYGLHERHERRFVHIGRWVLVAPLLAGVAIGVVREISDAAVGVLIAFLGGGVILNVMKEELPEERESRFSAFALGAALYTAILLAV